MKLARLALYALLFTVAKPVAAQQPADAAIAALRANSRAAHSDALLVIRNGRVLIDERSDPAADPVIEMMSATKAIVALAVMKAIDDGSIAGLDVPVHTWFPEWKQGQKQAITLRMLLNHTSGLQNVANAGVEVERSPDTIRLALAAELSAAPGTRFAYNNKATNLLSGIVARATGMPLDAYVQSRLFAPLGIDRYRWRRDPAGTPQAMAGLQLAAADAAKLGQLVLDRGQYAGKPVIRADRIDTLLAPGSDTSDDLGLMWARTPAFSRFTLERAGIERLRGIGLPADIVARLEPIVGTRFEGRAALRRALLARLGDGLPRWSETMVRTGNSPTTIFAVEKGPVAAFHAEGYLGQYIVVVPAARIVAVRQYRARRDPPPGDSYPGLVEDLLALAAAAR